MVKLRFTQGRVESPPKPHWLGASVLRGQKEPAGLPKAGTDRKTRSHVVMSRRPALSQDVVGYKSRMPGRPPPFPASPSLPPPFLPAPLSFIVPIPYYSLLASILPDASVFNLPSSPPCFFSLFPFSPSSLAP